jgi:hypothetical protein
MAFSLWSRNSYPEQNLSQNCETLLDCGAMRRLLHQRSIAYLLAISIITYTASGFACSSSDVSKIKKHVDQAASILLTTAKSNRELYQSGVYGATGSPEAIATRQKVARGIHEANEYLSDAVELAAQLQPGMSGQAVVDLLTKAVQELAHTKIGNDKIDVLIQSAVASLNTAIALSQSLKGK